VGAKVPVTYKNDPWSPAEIGDKTNVPFTAEFILISTVAPATYGSLKMTPPFPPHIELIGV
jgi:hypothetical protein